MSKVNSFSSAAQMAALANTLFAVSKYGRGGGRKTPRPVKRKRPRKRISARNRMVYRPHGDTEGQRSKKRKFRVGKRKKPTLKQKVKKLEKRVGRLPPTSRQMYRRLTNLEFAIAEYNAKSVYFVNGVSFNDYENAIENTQDMIAEAKAEDSALGKVDLRKANTKNLMMNKFLRYELKNFGNNNVKIKYQFVRCEEDENENAIVNMNENAVDRGFQSASFTATSAATAFDNEKPEHYQIELGVNNSQAVSQVGYPVFGVQTSKWKPLNPVTKIVLGPGDTTIITQKVPNSIYKPEDLDQDVRTYKEGDVYMIIEMVGDFCKNQSQYGSGLPGEGYENKLAIDKYFVLGTRYVSFDFVRQDGLGLKYVNQASTLDSTEVTAPVNLTVQDPTHDQFALG